MNRRYLKALDDKIERDSTPYHQPDIPVGPLSGRISLEKTASSIVTEFYIGLTHIEIDGLYVVSWTAPAAAIYFKKLKSWEGQRIRVRRTLVAKRHQIVNYADDWMIKPNGAAFPQLESVQPVQKPKPVSGPPKHSWLAQIKAAEDSASAQDLIPDTSEPNPQKPLLPSRPPMVSPSQQTEEPATSPAPDAGPTIGDLLRESLSAPRSTNMESVISTLQPEQYDLVTRDERKSLIVQGHAGTGKTIVATHRAAWLVNSQRAGKPLQRVLLFGPTIAWEDYVRGAITDLSKDAESIVFGSSHSLILRLLGITRSGGTATRWSEPKPPPVGADDLILDFASRWTGNPKSLDALGVFYREFCAADTRFEIKMSRSLESWHNNLPSFSEVIQDIQWWPMLAYMVVSYSNHQRYDHIIVDEAQDLTSFEWRILETLNSGTWTLTGDMQQRHSQKMFKKWKDIREWLAHSNWDEIQMNMGYRTTQAITDFAASLLPMLSRSRSISPLGHGKNPEIIGVKQRQRSLESLALEASQDLAFRHATGLVAIISPLVPSIIQEARKSGWTADGKRAYTSNRGSRIHVLTPEDARGLEFDAVVVVEPAIFRADTGTYGRLYTSLTRANHELVVIHDKPMPAPLERAARRFRSNS